MGHGETNERPARVEPRAGIHSANFRFPQGFLWGASTSAHQVEGGNTLNDWYDWEQAGRVPEKSGAAAEHWSRFRGDFDLARSLEHNAHRFSIEWSRIEPEPGEWSHAAIDHYRRVGEALLAAGIDPVVTFHHFTSPRWIADAGGWEQPDTAKRFADFCHRAAEGLAPILRRACTINEPNIVAVGGYLAGFSLARTSTGIASPLKVGAPRIWAEANAPLIRPGPFIAAKMPSRAPANCSESPLRIDWLIC